MSTAIIKNGVLSYKGSYLIRQRLILSILSGKPIRITNIRVFDDEPGLKEFEVNLLRLLDKITNGTIIELNETGTALFFQPGLLYGGDIEHDCSTKRSIGYYLETLVMLGFFCKKPLNVTLRGVTNNNIDPSVDLINTSMFNTLKNFIINTEELSLKIKKRGMLPLGGGEVVFKCPIIYKLRPVQLLNPGIIQRIRGTAYTVRVSPAISNRMVEKAKGILLNFLPDVYINTDQCKGGQSGKSPGFGIHLVAETNKGVCYSSEQVSENKELYLPEDVATKAAERLLCEIYRGGVTDSTCQSIALLFLALGVQDVSKIILGPLTEYTVGFIRHLKEFFGITMKIENYKSEDENLEGMGSPKILITCVGIGYSNISKRNI